MLVRFAGGWVVGDEIVAAVVYEEELASRAEKSRRRTAGDGVARHRMKKLLQRMLDESEFLSDYGVRAISRNHLEHPYVFRVDFSGLGKGTLRVAFSGCDARSARHRLMMNGMCLRRRPDD